MPKLIINEDKIIISLNPKIYPLEAIYGAAYVFLDRAYIYLDGDSKSEVRVSLKGKEKLAQNSLKKLGNEFLNELLNFSLRSQISKSNKKIREYIVGASLFGASPEMMIPSDIPEKEGGEMEANKEWKKDPLGIAIPWEEKFLEKKKKGLKNKNGS